MLLTTFVVHQTANFGTRKNEQSLSCSEIKLFNGAHIQQNRKKHLKVSHFYFSKRGVVKRLKKGEKLLTARGVTEEPNVIPGKCNVTGDVVSQVLL